MLRRRKGESSIALYVASRVAALRSKEASPYRPKCHLEPTSYALQSLSLEAGIVFHPIRSLPASVSGSLRR